MRTLSATACAQWLAHPLSLCRGRVPFSSIKACTIFHLLALLALWSGSPFDFMYGAGARRCHGLWQCVTVVAPLVFASLWLVALLFLLLCVIWRQAERDQAAIALILGARQSCRMLW